MLPWVCLHQVLLDAGADLAEVDENHDSALHVAAREGHLEAVQELLQSGLTTLKQLLNTRNTAGATPLVEAVNGDHKAVANALEGAGADPRLRLHWAAQNGEEDVKGIITNRSTHVDLQVRGSCCLLGRAPVVN